MHTLGRGIRKMQGREVDYNKRATERREEHLFASESNGENRFYLVDWGEIVKHNYTHTVNLSLHRATTNTQGAERFTEYEKRGSCKYLVLF